MSTSSDGGSHWSTPIPSADRASGNGGQPVVQPNGTVVLPFLGFGMESVRSTDGGKSWQSSVLIANANEHPTAGGLRDPGPLPSAEVDANGIVYVAWGDCSFRSSCTANDIVFSSSSDGAHWSAISRVPIDSLSKPRDHFLPGIGVDHTTGGSGAHLGTNLLLPCQHQLHFRDLPDLHRFHRLDERRRDLELGRPHRRADER